MKISSKSLSRGIFLVFLMLFVVLFSGCIEIENLGTSVSETFGIGGTRSISGGFYGEDVLELKIDTEGKREFDSMEPFIITVAAENKGVADATDIKVRLEGTNGIYSMGNAILSQKVSMDPSTLGKPDPDNQLLGGTGYVDWDVFAPFVRDEYPNREITMAGEVFYDFTSIASQKVVAVSRDYLNGLNDRGESIPVSSETDVLNGPISINIEVPSPYVKITNQRTSFRIKVHLNNDGTGSLYSDTWGLHYVDKIVLRVPKDLAVNENRCDFKPLTGTGVDIDKTLVIDATHNPSKLRLTHGGKQRVLNCELYAYAARTGQYNTYEFGVETTYTYLQSVIKELNVISTDESPVRLYIKNPNANHPDTWIKGSNAPVEFIVYYLNQPIDSSDVDISTFTDSINVNLDTTNAPLSFPLEFDASNSTWTARVEVPDMGTGNATYDLSMSLEYADLEAFDLKLGAVKYQST